MAEECVGVHLLCLLSLALDGEFQSACQILTGKPEATSTIYKAQSLGSWCVDHGTEQRPSTNHTIHRAPPKSFMRM